MALTEHHEKGTATKHVLRFVQTLFRMSKVNVKEGKDLLLCILVS